MHTPMRPMRIFSWTPFGLAGSGLLALTLAGCSSAETAGVPEITVLSARPDMVSGGDALVRVELPGGTAVDRVRVEMDGEDVTARFRQTDGALEGLLTDLQPGSNRVSVAIGSGPAVDLRLRNHPLTGPVFSGPHEQPFICETEGFTLPSGQTLGAPLDDDCSVARRVDYAYRSVDGGALKPLPDPTARPADLARTTTLLDEGVPYIVRIETGTINRSIYQIALLHDPASDPDPDPWQTPAGWNGRLIYTFGGGCTNGWYRQGMNPAQFVSAARKVVGLGAKGIKFNPWGGRPGIDFHRLENDILNAGVEVVGALRESLGPSVDLYIDCNGIFNTVGNAIRAAKAVEQFNISFFEEPVPHENTDAMAYVRRKIDIPVATGERLFTIFRFRELLERGGADVVQPDMAHCGGMLEARKIAAIADAHYAAFAPHNANGEISYASAVQLAACVPNFLVLEHFPPEPWRFEVCRNPLQVEDGWLKVPDRPGLGVEFDETAALDHPYEPVDLYNLHRPEMQLKIPQFSDRLR